MAKSTTDAKTPAAQKTPTSKKAATKTAAKKAPAARAPSKARTPAKKTTATRTATKKAASTKAATKAKPAPKKPVTAKSDAKTDTKTAAKPAAKAAKPVAKKTATKAATKTAAKPAAKKAAAKKAAPKPAAKKAAAKKATAKKATQKTAAKAAPKKPTPEELKAAAAKLAAKRAEALKSKALAKTAKAEPEPEPEPAKIAPAPLRPALKVARRAEANRDKNQTFKVRTKIVYPAHGVGYITEIEKQEIAGHKIELFVIDFEHEKMKLRVPIGKAAASGMRNLSKPERIDEMLKLIEGKARIKRTMWSRRAQEYEAKINSGDLQAVSEVVRDLFRADDQPEQSYSERQLFEQARERLGREIAAVRRKSLEGAIKEIHVHLDRKERPEAAA